MKNFALFLFCMITLIHLTGQNIENPGFEDWEDAGTVIDEPVDWSSIKTSDAGSFINNAAPVVWEQSSEAHSGNYSVKLFNVATFGIVATGIVTNGRVHADFDPDLGYVFTTLEDEGWNTPFTGRPDSIVAWAKYEPAGGDTARVQVLLHEGLASQPPNPGYPGTRIGYAEINISGNVNSWTRFAAPFDYYSPNNPEYILFVLSAGAGTQPVEGSIVYFDDLQLTYDASGVDRSILSHTSIHAANGYIYLVNLPEHYKDELTLDIFDLTGASIRSIRINNKQHRIKTSLKEGLYVVKLSGSEGLLTKKLSIR